jgi:hypothetical protein
MVTLEQVLVHPLFLLSIGAGASVGIGSLFTHILESRRKEVEFDVQDRWKKQEITVENRRKELEIKADLATKMYEVIAYQEANAFVSKERELEEWDRAEEEAYFERIRKSYMDVNMISSKLATYFPKSTIQDKWEKYYIPVFAFSNITDTYFFKDISKEQKEGFERHVKLIRDYFSDDTKIDPKDWDRFTTQMKIDEKLWLNVGELISHRGIDIVKEVLNLRIEGLLHTKADAIKTAE